jgi:endoglucanase
METFDLLKQLTEAPGPTGQESGAAAVIEPIWRPLVDEIVADRVGSLLGIKRGAGPADSPRPSILLAAHQDELGLMVSRIVEHGGYGFLRVTGLGGVDRRHLFGQTAVVHGVRQLTGVLGGLPYAYLPDKERDKAFSYETLVLDVGLPIEQVRELVSIGDFVTFRQPLRKLANGRVAGKALDNRSSVAAVTICLEHLQNRRHTWDIIAVATSQEEETFLGAYTSAYAQRPDAAIAIDVTHAKGPGSSDSELSELGGGPVLGIGANVHPGLFKALRDAADALEMKVGIDPHAAGSGTDAYAIQVAREGIPTGLVEIPLRYMHTMVETVDMADVERVGRLLAETIARLDENFLDDIREEMMRPDKQAKNGAAQNSTKDDNA